MTKPEYLLVKQLAYQFYKENHSAKAWADYVAAYRSKLIEMKDERQVAEVFEEFEVDEIREFVAKYYEKMEMKEDIESFNEIVSEPREYELFDDVMKRIENNEKE